MRRLLHLAGWLAVVPFGGLLAVRALEVSAVPFDWLWAYLPELFVPVWVVAAVALVARFRALGATAALVALVHLSLVLPSISGRATGDRPNLRVVSANVLFRNAQLEAQAHELLRLDADVLVLQEVTAAGSVVLGRVLGADYPHRAEMLRDDPLGALVLSRLPLSDSVVISAGGLPVLTTVADVDGRKVRLWDVHTVAPTGRGARAARDRSIRALIEPARAEPLPLLAVGDFNATVWHPAFDDLVDATGLVDAHDAVGRGLRGTWKGLPLFETPIDHALVSDHFTVVDVHNAEGVGSDHRPVVVDLRFSGRSGT